MIEIAEACTEPWCKGRYADYRKHRRLGQDACLATKDEARAYQAKRDRSKRKSVRWVPGTSILVPEIDPL